MDRPHRHRALAHRAACHHQERALITVRNLSFGFSRRPIFDDLSFELPDRGLVAVTGPNGVGKTTLLRVLAGTYRSNAQVLTAAGGAATAIYLDDEVLTLDTLTVDEVVRLLAAELRDVAGDRLRANPLLTASMRATRLAALSLGQRQRCVIALACSLARADVVLLDEPFNALDAEGVAEARRQLAELASTHLVLFATHLASDVDDFADHVLAVTDSGSVESRSDLEGVLAWPS